MISKSAATHFLLMISKSIVNIFADDSIHQSWNQFSLTISISPVNKFLLTISMSPANQFSLMTFYSNNNLVR
jgi:hypothetical protein